MTVPTNEIAAAAGAVRKAALEGPIRRNLAIAALVLVAFMIRSSSAASSRSN